MLKQQGNNANRETSEKRRYRTFINFWIRTLESDLKLRESNFLTSTVN